MIRALCEAWAQDHQSTTEMILRTVGVFDSRHSNERRERATILQEQAQALRRMAEDLRQPVSDSGFLLVTDASVPRRP